MATKLVWRARRIIRGVENSRWQSQANRRIGKEKISVRRDRQRREVCTEECNTKSWRQQTFGISNVSVEANTIASGCKRLGSADADLIRITGDRRHKYRQISGSAYVSPVVELDHPN